MADEALASGDTAALIAQLSANTPTPSDEAPPPPQNLAANVLPKPTKDGKVKYVRHQDGSVWLRIVADNGNIESKRVDFPHGKAPKGIKV